MKVNDTQVIDLAIKLIKNKTEKFTCNAMFAANNGVTNGEDYQKFINTFTFNSDCSNETPFTLDRRTYLHKFQPIFIKELALISNTSFDGTLMINDEYDNMESRIKFLERTKNVILNS